MSGFLEAAVVVYHFVEETGRRKTILEISVKDMVGIIHQVLAILLFAILQSIESVQQRTSHKPTSATSVLAQVAVSNSTPE